MATSEPTKAKPICHIRQIKTGSMIYDYHRKTQNNSQAKVPWLQLKGHWLDQAGFSIDTPVTVRVMEGCLVLTAEQQVVNS
ncbi:SymE family type I addiction module toxin [Teredinibacter sp. KSP-S5-2]|uniref:SymE family type I addiction module toxin n=1 Tax=Teredinibacter sp. KSP-S5-2 TaxID=3034506 RepID=UPI002934A1F7|nr:SymE family type I addiction module toxin [Teredinibacter sp. KSP-S5-2]WNO11316.1 SymE family type I addiction module toxin [Teredinibacter sp. KSP-S5-2]